MILGAILGVFLTICLLFLGLCFSSGFYTADVWNVYELGVKSVLVWDELCQESVKICAKNLRKVWGNHAEITRNCREHLRETYRNAKENHRRTWGTPLENTRNTWGKFQGNQRETNGESQGNSKNSSRKPWESLKQISGKLEGNHRITYGELKEKQRWS